MEQMVRFASGSLELEGLFEKKGGDRGVVVSHPHPLYGGDMGNPVVEAVAAAFSRKGYSSLRFNFRGVGRSEGRYDDGRGEQDDILAAVDFLRTQGMRSVHLAGYSFGSWVLARIAHFPPEVSGLMFISPPLALLPLPASLELPLLQLVITGEEDEIAPPELVREAVVGWNDKARFELIDGADHFYFGSFRELEARIDKSL